MAANKPSIPKGTRDFSPAEVHKRKYILNTIESVFKKYGFMPIETPTMENLSTLEGKYGDEGDKLLFKVSDSGDFLNDSKRKIKNQQNNSIKLTRINRTLIEFLREVTNRIFIVHQLSEHQAKEQHDLFFFIDKILDEVFRSDLKSSELLSFNEISIVKDFVRSNLSVISYCLSDFYSMAQLHYETDRKELDFQFEQFLNQSYETNILPTLIFEIGSINYSPMISEKGLRYDLTVPFARYVVMNRNEITFPFKRYQMQPVWRADRPQKGRYREFWQCDADVVGSDSLLNELDLIQIYDEAFTKLGIANYELRMNNRKVLAGIAEVVKSVEYMSTIAIAIDKLDKIGEEGVRKELSEQQFSEDELNRLFEIISIKGENEIVLNELKSKLQTSQEGIKGIEELEFILKALHPITQSTNHPINLKLDFSLARGLSYYTGCIFEVVSTDGTLKSSIGGGGRYDNLTGIFGLPNVSGVGISFGLDRIYDVMDELKLFPSDINTSSTKVLICAFDAASQSYALAPLRQLRDAGIAAELYPDIKKLGKQLDYANALHIPFAIIIGDTEMQSGKLVLKNLNEGSQQELLITEIIHLLGDK